MLIAPAAAADMPQILQLVEHAFGQPDEAELVARLYGDGDASILLVARIDSELVGQVLLSPMQAPFRALGLAPLCVSPLVQRQGVGSALMRAAIAEARAQGWQGIFLLGDERYYSRFGFRADLAAGFDCVYAGPHFQLLPLESPLPATTGMVGYAPSFAGLG